MYIPAAYQVNDRGALHAFIQQFSFATLVSHGSTPGSAPVATHLPLLLRTDSEGHSMLIGHEARANSQWKHAAGQSVLAIFQGPHAYISPAWYGEQNVVPTWNYVAVHVTGLLTIEEDPERLEDLVRDAVAHYELSSVNPWSMDAADPQFLRRLAHQIVGLRIDVQQMEGCWKLNQHHPAERRQRTVDGLLNRGRADDVAIASLMQCPPPPTAPST